jgi:PAS domain S-box-containing protein
MPTEKSELRAIFDNLPLGIAYLDSQFKFIRVNKFFAELTGMREEELLGKPCYETVGEHANDPIRKGLEKICSFCKKEGCFNSKKPCVIERPLKDRLLRVRTIPQMDEQGETRHLLELFEDITESKQAEESVRESERKFRMLSQEYHTLLDAIRNSIFLLSPDLKVIWANKYAINTMGYPLSETGRRNCFDLLKHAEAPCMDCHALKCFQTGETTSGKISCDDGRIWASDAFPVKDEQGRVNKVIMIYRDVTEETRLRAETMHAAHMASLGELAAGVAHEINNPINGIVNYAQMLADKSEKDSREHDIAKEMIGECRRITGIVRSLLSFAKSGQEEKTPVSIPEVLSNTLSLSQRLLEKNGVHLKADLPPNPPPVIANPNQIQQVFLNLINNALYALNQKYPGTDRDKRLEITGKKISRDGRPYFRMTFHDRGTGIPASILDKVAHPFFSTKPAGQGTGLGLSISYGIISDHDGRMQIESQEGAFTTVTIELPAQCKTARTVSMKMPRGRPGNIPG